MVDGMSARLRSAGRSVDELKGKARDVSREMDGLDKASAKVKDTIGKLAAAFTARELVSKIATVRGEFQQLEVAFKTMLGSADKANALMAQLTHTAAVTPFGMEDVAQGAKQLLAYGLEAEKVNGTLIRLGDIAAGLSVPLNDLVYLYGTTMTQGRLYTQDLNQFTGRGIPMVAELAKQFGVAEDKVKGLVEEGRVGFPQVQKVIESLTNTGGKFGGLMEAQSHTITGQLSNIEDAFDMMFNNIGKQSEGMINTVLGGVTTLVENYEKVARELLAIAAAYGIYKAAVVALSAVEKARYTLTLAIGAAEKTVTTAQAIRYAMTTKLAKAQEILNDTMIKNPYGLVAAAVAGLAYGIYKLATMQTDAEKAQKKLDDATKEYNKNVASEQIQIDSLFARLKSARKGTQEFKDAKDAIISQYGTYLNKLGAEVSSLNDVEAAYKAVSKAARDAARARAMEAFTKDAADSYAETESDEKEKLYQLLKKKYGNKKAKSGRNQAEELYWQLVGVINGSKKLNENWVKQFDETHVVGGDSQFGIGAYSYTTNAVKDILSSISKARATYNTSMDEAKRRFGEAPGEEKKEKKNTPEVKDYDYWEKRKKEAENQLKALDSSKKGSKEWNRLQQEIRTAQDKMDGYSTSKSDKAVAKAERQRQKEEKAEERRAQARQELGERLADLETQNQERDIDIMEDGREKRLREIEKDYKEEENAITKKAHDLAELNKKAGVKGLNANGLTKEQQDAIDKANDLNKKQKEKSEADLLKEDAQAMRDYLKEYGNYQQQKLAIAEEYAEKIRKTQSEGERMKLTAERDSALRGVEQKALSREIDWQGVFGEMTGLLGEQLKETLTQLEAYTKTDEFRGRSDTDKQTIYEAIDRLRETVPGGKGTLDFGKIRTQMEALGVAVSRYRQATVEQEQAYDNLKAAQNDYENAMKSGTDEQKAAAKATLSAAQSAASSADEAYSQAATDVQNLGEEYRAASTDTIKGLNSVADGLQGFASGTLQGAFQGLQKTLDGLSKLNIGGAVGDAVGKLSETLSSAGFIGQLISAILSILDILKDGIGPLISGIIDTVLNAVSGILDNILSGKFVTQIGSSLIKGVGGILDAVTFGGFSSWFGNGDSDKTLHQDIEYLTASNENLKQAIDNLADKMKEAPVSESTGMYERQKKLLEESIANTQEMMRRSGAAYSNGFLGIGGKHSSNKKVNDAMSGEDWNRISEIVGRSIRSASDFWTLTSEEMARVADEATDLYSKIEAYADDGHENAAQYMDEYIEYYKQLEELQDAYNEKLTGFSFDSVRDSFKDMLLDMSADADDFAADIEETLFGSVVEGMMSETYTQRLKEWYQNFASEMKATNGKLDQKEADKMREEYNKIVQDALAERDKLVETLGIDPDKLTGGTSQSAKSGGFTAMTQDQGTKLEGMFTSGLQHWSSMDQRMEEVSVKMSLAEGHLAKIEENTGVSASHLNEIKEDLKKVIRDGLKVK